MKIALEKNIKSPIKSFTISELIEPYFDPNWHFHSHYQLFTVLEGTGTRFIGDNIQHFEPGDTVFLGPDLPHLWSSDKAYFQHNSKLKTHGIVVYFTEDFLGESFFNKPEMQSLSKLLQRSKSGISFHGKTKDSLMKSMKKLTQQSNFESVLSLLTILNKISKTTDYQIITSISYANTHKESETDRMQKVHDYVIEHFREKIQLREISNIVNMSEAAFCRYFKKRANKTFSDFVNEVRIGNACKLLVSEEIPIAQVAFECGFNTLSNFNRQFQKITCQPPSVYRKEMLGR
ncbi:MAG: AraC family transcriptional regulator [Spirosomaceae bacterium]|nr:AraC family transcriptional regulator [Spirosomataceae bacterium]